MHLSELAPVRMPMNTSALSSKHLFNPIECNLDQDTNRMLLELGGPEDPVWIFLDSQHKRILERLHTVYNESVASIEGLSRAFMIVMNSETKLQNAKRPSILNMRAGRMRRQREHLSYKGAWKHPRASSLSK
jgi:hypothetical protein